MPPKRRTTIPGAAGTTAKEYGRRPYVSSSSYRNMMAETTDKGVFDQRLEAHSELKKPYKSDDYQEMEYLYPPMPGFNIDSGSFGGGDDSYQSKVDLPWNKGGGTVPEIPSPYHIIFMCHGSPCYCPSKTKCATFYCDWPIKSTRQKAGTPCRVSVKGKKLCVTAPDNVSPSIEIEIIMEAKITADKKIGKKTIKGKRHNGTWWQIITECYDCCTEDPAFAWNDDGSDDTIDQNGSAAVAVTGNNGPFDWSVSGTGFTISYEKTDGRSNTIWADATACGSATVTVTGCDGSSASGSVRCTDDSQWTWESDDEVDPCYSTLSCTPPPPTCPSTYSGEYTCDVITENTKKTYTFHWYSCGSPGCSCVCNMGNPPCAEPVGTCKAYKSSNYTWECA